MGLSLVEGLTVGLSLVEGSTVGLSFFEPTAGTVGSQGLATSAPRPSQSANFVHPS